MKHKGYWLAAVVSTLLSTFVWAQETPPASDNTTATTSSPTVAPITAAPAAVNNLLRNGDFEHGKQDWETRGKVIVLDNQPALQIEGNRREAQNAVTVIRLDRDIRVFKISLRLKASDDYVAELPSLGSVKLRINKAHGHAFREYTLKAGDNWQNINWTHEVEAGVRELVLQIEVRPAKGSVYISHVVVEGREG